MCNTHSRGKNISYISLQHFLQNAQKIFILFLCPFMRTFCSAACHPYFFGDMAGKQQGVHVLDLRPGRLREFSNVIGKVWLFQIYRLVRAEGR